MPKKRIEKSPVSSEDLSKKKLGEFPIVGIGASAGGLDAIEQFFRNMAVDSGMAFVIIQHLDPDHKGLLQELVQRVTKMKVITASNQLLVEQNNIYILPPNKSMSISNGTLHLYDPIEKRGQRLPIDLFFNSLADDQHERGVGIILSGMGSDGSIGLKSIKENGGLVLVQEPTNARFDSMPRSAIQSVLADIVAPVDELPKKLSAIIKISTRFAGKLESEKNISSLEKLIILLRKYTGNDFSQYKKTTLYRRVERRMSIHQIERIDSYVSHVEENSNEGEILFKELLIGVTSFFRDVDTWDYLRDVVFPDLFARLPHGQVLRAWTPGCSTGEEAYSLAIVFKEALGNLKSNKSFSLQIFATDLDSSAIDKARKAIYPANIVSNVSHSRLKRFFVKTDEKYRVTTDIREMVVFAQHNVIKDPPFTRLNLLTCRNLLIYLDNDLQKKLMTLFHYSLVDNGVLMLGSAETNGSLNDIFVPVDTKLRIYRRIGIPKTEELYEFPSSFSQPNSFTEKHNKVNVPDKISALTEQLILHKFSPASVLTTDKGDIIYITGSTGKYLEPAVGKANMNIFAMARDNLINELSDAYRKSIQTKRPIVLHKVKFTGNSDYQSTEVTIQQIEKPSELRGKILVVFRDVTIIEQRQRKSGNVQTQCQTTDAEIGHEMKVLKDELQRMREEMQTSKEELKSTNEELQSTNEELQSTNEELTTSKEEMQSLNEELHTMNIELQSKIDDTVRATNDMNNILNSSEIATLFLDKEFKIRQFTPSLTKIFKLIPGDIGRPYTDQVNNLNYPEMLSDIKEVLTTLVYAEKLIEASYNRWYVVRIMPYRTFDDKIDGVVITFIDSTKQKELEIALLTFQSSLNLLIQKAQNLIIGISNDGKIIEFNPVAEKILGRKHKDVIGEDYFNLFIPDEMKETHKSDIKLLLSGNLPVRFKNLVKTANEDKLTLEWTAHKLPNESGKQMGIIAICENIDINKSPYEAK